jgi:nucleolar protein 58
MMKSLVPEEKLELTKEDRLPMSKGMTILLEHNSYAVKPHMVTNLIIEMAYALYDVRTNMLNPYKMLLTSSRKY